jgi:CheY-like chemotaxis protein
MHILKGHYYEPFAKAMSFNILLVDDSPADAEILVSAFASVGLHRKHIQLLDNGDDVLAVLEHAEAKELLPRIILIDLKSSNQAGFEVLKSIKEHPKWQMIPVIFMSQSMLESDIRMSYQLNANAYIKKPESFEEYRTIAENIHGFWQTIVKLPGTSSCSH